MDWFFDVASDYDSINDVLLSSSSDSTPDDIETMVNVTVPKLVSHLLRLSEFKQEPTFAQHARHIANELHPDSHTITPNLIQRVWKEQNVPKFIEMGELIFTAPSIVERLVATLSNMNSSDYTASMVKIRQAVDYNTLCCDYEFKYHGVIPAKQEYLLRHKEEFDLLTTPDTRNRKEREANLRKLMSYHVTYFFSQPLIENKVHNHYKGKGMTNRVFIDLVELYAIGHALQTMRYKRDENGRLSMPDLMNQTIRQSLVFTILPMRCQYTNYGMDTVLSRLDLISSGLDKFLTNHDATSVILQVAELHLRFIADYHDIEWYRVPETYEELNKLVIHEMEINKEQEQQQEDQDMSLNEEQEQELLNAELGDIRLQEVDVQVAAAKPSKVKRRLRFKKNEK